jgi:serine/threonine protein kinase
LVIRKDFSLTGKYQITSLLGEGGSGKVFLAQKYNKSIGKNHEYALKVIKKKDLDKETLLSFVSEIRIQRELQNCKNIIKLYKIFESVDKISILLEY